MFTERKSWKTDPGAAHAEATRRVKEARRTGALVLFLNGDSGGHESLNALDIVPNLDGMPYLRSLNLNDTRVSDISQLAGLDSLERIRLDNTLVSDLSALTKMTALEALKLDGTRVSNMLPIRNLQALNKGARRGGGISYSYTPATRDPVLAELVQLNHERRTHQTLLYLNGKHPVHGGPPKSRLPSVPDMPADGAPVIPARYDGKRLMADGLAPEDAELEMLFGILKREAHDLGDYGSLHNIAKPTAIALDRYVTTIPAEYSDLDKMGQVRLGIEGTLLNTKYSGARAMLNVEFPDKVGVIDALLVAHTLLIDRLAEYQAFLKVAETDPDLTEAQEIMLIERVQAIEADLETTPDTVDPAISLTLSSFRLAIPDVKYAAHAVLRGLYDIVRGILVWVKTELVEITADAWTAYKPALKKDIARVLRLGTLGALGEISGAIPWFAEKVQRGLDFLRQLDSDKRE